MLAQKKVRRKFEFVNKLMTISKFITYTSKSKYILVNTL